MIVLWLTTGILAQTSEAPPVTDTYPPASGYYEIFNPERHKRKRLDEEEAPEPKRPDVEIVKINDVITGIVQPKNYGKKLTTSSEPFERIAKQKSSADMARRERLARIIKADDDWLMMS